MDHRAVKLLHSLNQSGKSLLQSGNGSLYGLAQSLQA
jgi:hypothetical protein